VDQIGGWQTGGVGHGYGSGYPLEVLYEWMAQATEGRTGGRSGRHLKN